MYWRYCEEEYGPRVKDFPIVGSAGERKEGNWLSFISIGEDGWGAERLLEHLLPVERQVQAEVSVIRCVRQVKPGD